MNTFTNKLLTILAMISLSSTVAIGSAALATEPTPSVEAQQSQPLAVGTKAPDFHRVASNGKKISLKSFRGKSPVVLYFYPKDETPGCIKEACGFRDFFHQMEGKGAEIIGISGDADDSHKAFAQHYQLPFDLISDTDNRLLELYHVPLFKGSLHKRTTFIIDKHGIITNVIKDTNDGDEHVKQATAALQNLQK